MTVVAALAAVPSAAVGSEVSASTRRVHIYHTDGTQGQLEPTAPTRSGGMARIVGLLAAARGRSPSAIFVDAGDVLGSAPLSEFDGGRLMVRLMGEAGYDAMVVGNHEFDYGLDTLRARVADAEFPFLGANVRADSGAAPVRAWHIVDRGEARIGFVGLLSPQLSRLINPLRNPGLQIVDPGTALEETLPALADSADLVVGLVHMPMAEAIDLASRFPAVRLWIVGGGSTEAVRPHDVQLADGTHVVTTPDEGHWIGHVEIQLPAIGQPSGRQIRSRLIGVDSLVAEEAAVAQRIDALRTRFEAARGEPLTEFVEPIDDAGTLVADIVRTRTGAEVCVLNRGALRDHGLAATVRLVDVDRLVRYEDRIVLVELTGGELKKMAASAAARKRAGQRLVLSGFDVASGRVDGRPIDAEERYLVATSAFLAAGGDGYLHEPPSRAPVDAPLTLRSVVVDHLRAFPLHRSGTGIALGTGGTWKQQTKLSGSLSRTGIGSQAQRYQGVSFLGGKDAMAWNSILTSQITRASHRGVLTLNVRSTFGQVRELDHFRESADRLQTEWVYTWDRSHPAPFVSTDLNTVWTVPAGEKRPFAARSSAGLQRAFGGAKVRLGLGLERDFAADDTEVGLEIVPEYRRQFARRNSISSNLKVFAGATRTRKVSAQHYNTLLLNLGGNLYLTLDANLFLHRDDEVNRLGWKSELQIGVGYTVQSKWI